MAYRCSLLFLFYLLLLACGDSRRLEGESQVQRAKVTKSDIPPTPSPITDQWVPAGVEHCLQKKATSEAFLIESGFNPFYLRADFDGNDQPDLAIIVVGEKSNKRGVLICKDMEQTFLFGALSNAARASTSFENDNFVTNEWEVASREETRTRSVRHARGRKAAPDAKGESVVFAFEGSDGVVIYWNGKSFVISE